MGLPDNTLQKRFHFAWIAKAMENTDLKEDNFKQRVIEYIFSKWTVQALFNFIVSSVCLMITAFIDDVYKSVEIMNERMNENAGLVEYLIITKLIILHPHPRFILLEKPPATGHWGKAGKVVIPSRRNHPEIHLKCGCCNHDSFYFHQGSSRIYIYAKAIIAFCSLTDYAEPYHLSWLTGTFWQNGKMW